MARVLTIASVLGIYGVIESFGMFWIVRDYLASAVAGGPGSDLSQAAGFRPHDDLSDAQQGADLGASLAELEARRRRARRPSSSARWSWSTAGSWRPTGWRLALMVWGYTLVSFFVASAIKIGTYRLLEHRAARQSRHLARIEGHVAAATSDCTIDTLDMRCSHGSRNPPVKSFRILTDERPGVLADGHGGLDDGSRDAELYAKNLKFVEEEIKIHDELRPELATPNRCGSICGP